MYQKSVLLMSVMVSLFLLGGLWVALVQTQLVAEDDGSGSADGALSDLAMQRKHVVVVTFLVVEILVCASSFLFDELLKRRRESITDASGC